MTIVCGTDFSENAEQAARAAAAIARALGETLTLVHVVREDADSAAASLTGENLRAKGESLTARAGVTVVPIVLRGAPHEKLVEIAGSERARLLVLSALGGQRQQSWLLGSVAERVAQCSSVPVLVVRDTGSLQAWAEKQRPLRVALASDLDQSSKAALDFFNELRGAGPSQLTILQIAWPFSESARLGRRVLAETDRLLPDAQQLLVRDLRNWAGSAAEHDGTEFVVSPGWGRVDHHIALLAAELKSDLIVVGMHQRAAAARFWLGSVSRGVIHYSGTNVLCVPRSGVDFKEPAIPTYKSVLIPTDFSELANRAVPRGYGLLPAGGTVHLLYVLTREPREESSDPKQRLLGLVPSGARARGITSEIHVLNEPDAGIAIWHAAGRLGVDVICMSTHGRSGLSALVLGSQAHEVLCRARQPVLLVPPERGL